MSDLSPAELVKCRDRLLRTHAPATVVRYMAALSHAFTIAIREWGWLEESPMRKVTKPKEPRGRIRFLSDDERDRLLEVCRESYNPYIYPVVVLALSTGARKMEILRLTWQDIDFNRRVMTFHNTKNGERRVVPLVVHALQLVEQRFEDSSNSRFVFPSRNGKKPFDIQRAWKAALREAEISDFRFHDLRHSAASYLAMNGASLAEISEILGHKTLAMVKRYAHLSEAHTAGVVARMNEKIFGME